jgi:TetR/AcrR family transcriptional regulator of autoinduction and epiphytic fitness
MAPIAGPATAVRGRAAPAQPAPEGRLTRGERTRRQLAEALVSLLEEGDPRPTARAVAARAGVSLRLVFHHFADMESVLRAAVAVQTERHWRRLAPIDPHLARPERIRLVVRQRARLYEAVAPVRRAALAMEHTSAVVGAELRHSRRSLRRHLEEAFAPELARAGGRRARLADALELATSFESWEQLRRTMGLGPGAAAGVTADLVEAVLEAHDQPDHRGGRR